MDLSPMWRLALSIGSRRPDSESREARGNVLCRCLIIYGGKEFRGLFNAIKQGWH